MALQQLLETQKLAQQVAQSNSKGKPCPYCGGDAIPNYQRCKNCASPLSWVEGHPCKPGEEGRLTQSLAEDRKQAAEKEVEDNNRRYQEKISEKAAQQGCTKLIAVTGIVLTAALCLYAGGLSKNIGFFVATTIGILVLAVIFG